MSNATPRVGMVDVSLLAVEDFDYVPTPIEDIEAGMTLEVDTGHGLTQFRVETRELLYEEGKPATVKVESGVIESVGGPITMTLDVGTLVNRVVSK